MFVRWGTASSLNFGDLTWCLENAPTASKWTLSLSASLRCNASLFTILFCLHVNIYFGQSARKSQVRREHNSKLIVTHPSVKLDREADEGSYAFNLFVGFTHVPYVQAFLSVPKAEQVLSVPFSVLDDAHVTKRGYLTPSLARDHVTKVWEKEGKSCFLFLRTIGEHAKVKRSLASNLT